MRLFSKIFSIIFVLYVLSILFVPSVKADCYFDAYTHCVGTCSCPKAGTCTCKLDSTGHVCQADTTYCCSSHRTVLIKRLLDKSKQGKVGFVKNHNPGGENAEQPSI